MEFKTTVLEVEDNLGLLFPHAKRGVLADCKIGGYHVAGNDAGGGGILLGVRL